MKIAFFYNVPPGGAKRVIYEEIKYLSENHHDVDIYTYDNTDETYMQASEYVKNIFKFKNKITNNTKRLNRIIYDLKVLFYLDILSKKVADKINMGSYDIVIVHPDNFTQAPYLLKHLKTPSIYFCEELLRNAYEKKLDVDRNLPFINYYYEKMIRFIRRRVDKKNSRSAGMIMTGSDYIRKKVENVYKKPSVVNKLGVDTNTFRNMNINRQDSAIFVGSKEDVTGYYFIKDVIDNIKMSL